MKKQVFKHSRTSQNTEVPNRNTVVGKRLFLTIPHFEELDKVFEALTAKSEKELFEDFAVVLETHSKDPRKAKHLHVFVKFTKRREVGLNFFDFLGKHGCLQAVRNQEAVLQYMNKENVCRANFDVWRSLLSHTRAMASRTVARMALLGYNLNEVQVKYYDVLASLPWESIKRFAVSTVINADELKRAKSLSDVLRWIDRDLIEARLTPEELETFDSDPQFQVLVDYINRVKKYGSEQVHKECTLSLVSAPSTGKSSLLLKLAEHYNNYNFPIDGWHRESYRNHYYSMWTWNEWDIKAVPWPDFLLLLEGFQTDLRVKNSKTLKLDRPMIFMLSNDSYKEQFVHRFSYLHGTKTYDVRLRALEVRICELNFGEKNLFFLQKLLVGVTEDIA